MAPHSRSDSESSEDDGAPEIISLVQSKKAIQKLDAELKKAEMAERQSKRRQNREVDRKLKERADMNRGGKKKKEEDELEARMQRAMQEAQEETDEEGENESESEIGSRDEGEDEENNGEDEEDNGEDEEDGGEDEEDLEDDQGSEEDEEDDVETLAPKPKKKTYNNPDHLPDELFTAAFASQASTSKRKATEDEEDKPLKQTPKKKRKRSHTQKDLIVGYVIESMKFYFILFYFFRSRTIRTLPTLGQPITPSVAPSSKINKFLNRTLALKGGKQKTKTWERRPGREPLSTLFI